MPSLALTGTHDNGFNMAAVFTGTYAAAPTGTLKVSLATVVGTASTPGTEVSGGSYARQAASWGVLHETLSNTAGETFTNMPAVTVVGVDSWDSAATPLRYLFGSLSPSLTTNAGDTLSFASSAVVDTWAGTCVARDGLHDAGDLTLQWLAGNSGSFAIGATPMKVALCTAVGSDSAAGTEVSGGSYARQGSTVSQSANAVNFSATSFTNMPAVTVTSLEEWDSASTPNRYLFGNLTASKTTNAGDTFSLAASAFNATFT